MDLHQIAQQFQKHGFQTSVFASAKEACDYLDKQIDGRSVSYGGSMSVAQMGLLDRLQSHNDVIGHWNVPDGMTRQEVYAKAAVTDVYLTSANGVSETGELVNIDGHGNRVSSCLFGHKKVCAVKGDKCYDCNSPERICNGFVIHARKLSSCDTEIVFVNEPLGY